MTRRVVRGAASGAILGAVVGVVVSLVASGEVAALRVAVFTVVFAVGHGPVAAIDRRDRSGIAGVLGLVRDERDPDQEEPR